MKNPFSHKKEKFTKATAPRSSAELQALCNDLLTRAAKTQYTQFLCARELEQINTDLMAVNQEGAERQKLDQEVARDVAAKAEVNKKVEGAK